MSMEQTIYILTALSVSATLTGIAFALYGWWNISKAEHIVEKKVAVHADKIKHELRDKAIQAQDAMHKIIASYTLSAQGDHAGAISLLEAAVSTDPDAFNGYAALGYEYWKAGRQQEAVECFVEAKERFPHRIEPYNDLARIYAAMGEVALALKYIEEFLERAPHAYQTIEHDAVFDHVRSEQPEQYQQIIRRFC